MDIEYANINELLEGDEIAVEYFNTLPDKIQKALLERGDGINNYDELVHFSEIIKKRGYKDTTGGCCH